VVHKEQVEHRDRKVIQDQQDQQDQVDRQVLKVVKEQ
jgi:hypothetical protein